jgi:hypothetical protein
VPVWGINFKRDIARRNESDYLTFTPSNGSGFVSRFPELQGLELNPPRRIELLPYTTAKAEFVSHDPGDPYNDGSVYGIGVGGDFRVGLGSNLTINGTINPDFGQVEVDPAVVNLSDVETFFPERRPFFVEGANTFTNFGFGGSNNYWGFNWSSFDFIYTRRIGRAPTGATPDDASYVDEPGGTTILGALKLSGKMGGWNVGALSSLTKREFADYQVEGTPGNVAVEPLTSWNAIRVQKDIAGGAQGIGFISTITALLQRVGPSRPDEPRRSHARRGRWTFLDEDRKYVLTGWFGSSLVTGTTVRMTDLQEGSVHYFQRPDQDYVHVDSAATSLAGFGGRLVLNKQKGNVQLNASLAAINPGLELNDVGFAPRTDLINSHVVAGYRGTRPTHTYQRANFNVALFGAWDFGWDNTGLGTFANGNILFNNFWSARARIGGSPETVNIRATRGGPAILNPPGFDGAVGFSSDDRKRVVLNGDFYYNRYQQGADNSWGSRRTSSAPPISSRSASGQHSRGT